MTSEQMLARRALKLARDLLAIAETAMPESYFISDSRCAHARETLLLLTKRKRPGKLWSIWSEGYAATGERAGAAFHGTVAARTFREACRKTFEDEPTYDAKDNTLWGCRLYSSEAAARRSFG